MRRLLSSDGLFYLLTGMAVVCSSVTVGVTVPALMKNQPTAQAQIIPGPVVPLASAIPAASGPSWSSGDSQCSLACVTATALTVPSGTRAALIQVEGANVRWRDDGTDPDVSTGNIIYAGDTLEYNGPIVSFRAIQTAATATLNVSYYR